MTDNIRMQVEKTKEGRRILTITIDLDVDFGLTQSRRALLVAGTESWMPIKDAEDTAIALTCTRKRNGGQYCGGRSYPSRS